MMYLIKSAIQRSEWFTRVGLLLISGLAIPFFALSQSPLSVLAGRPEYMATQFEAINPAVAAHPNDAGMARIAELIWEQMK